MRMDNFDAIIYIKSGKYFGVNEKEKSSDIFKMITGLDVSSGAVVVTKNGSAIFVDGRYINAAKKSVDMVKFEILNFDLTEIKKWIEEKLHKNSKIAYDPKFFTHNLFKKIKLESFCLESIDLENFLGITTKKRELNIEYINRSFPEDRRTKIYEVIDKNNLDAYLLCDPSTISWILNIRDFDARYCPVVSGFLLITKDRLATLYVSNLYSKIPETNINIQPENELFDDLKNFDLIGFDEAETTLYLKNENFVHIKNPCILQKSIKNQIEINDIKIAATKDSAAIVNFLHWLYSSTYKSKTSITELDVVEQIFRFRTLQDGFIGESFPCIAAADENSAMAHYSPSQEHNRIVKNILLLDSGGQYKYGTTDITRTVCINEVSDEQKLFYTLVLKGHIALANAKFPIGTTGSQLDLLARQYLWNYSCDYNHATGHGIGYMLNVHEDPIAISKSNSVPLYPGMVLSNEPAYYKANDFGVRLENMLLVKNEYNIGFLSFETISLVPFDSKFIDKKLLTDDEILWINSYHNRVVHDLKNYLDEEILRWLRIYSIFPS